MPQPTRLFGLAGTLPGGSGVAASSAAGPGSLGEHLLPILGPWPENPGSLLGECGLKALIPKRAEETNPAGPASGPAKAGVDFPRRIALIGPMGVGKSSVGRALARLSGLPFVDADEVIAAEAGMDIPAIFAKEGEAGFRALEARVLATLLGGGPLVLATGGGAVLAPENRALLQAAAQVVWLHAPVAVLASRVEGGASRPLLAGGEVEEKLASIYRLRLPYYVQCADFLLPVGRSSPQTLAEVIHDALLHALPPGR